MAEKLLEVKNLRTEFKTGKKSSVTAVDDVSFSIDKGEVLGLVGESGCGKSVTSLSIMGLLLDTSGKVTNGEVLLDGEDLLKLSKKEMRSIRGRKMSMIFQNPMSSLNPCMRVERQLTEAILLHNKFTKEQAHKRAFEVLQSVGIPDPDQTLKSYPHQLSGGMSQRVMIAMALSCDPELLIADEPTTALDVTIQAQIVELLKELKEKLGMAIIFITHDLGVVSDICDNIMVMYAGKVIEEGTSRQVFYERKHPYTEGLLSSVPKLDQKKDEKLKPIKGNPPDMSHVRPGCAFAPRCGCAMQICVKEEAPMCELDDTHKVSCWQVVRHEMEEQKR